MDAMTILKRCRGAADEIARIEQRIRQRRSVMSSLGSPLSNTGGGRSAAGDRMSGLMADLDQLERQLTARKERRNAEVASSCALLDELPSLESSVLFGFYVGRENVPALARRLKYQEGYVRRVKKKGEELLAMIGPEQVAATLPTWYTREEREE